MHKIIQIRGSSASGKTTAVREFIKKNKLVQQNFSIGQINIPITTNNSNSLIIIGQYHSKNGGCDLLSGSTELLIAIIKLYKLYKPEAIIFEGMLYSKSFEFNKKIEQIAKKLRIKYTSIFLKRSFNSSIELLEKRNGGAEYNIESIINIYNQNLSTTKKMISAGMGVKIIDVENYNINQMGGVIDEELRN